MSSFSTRIFHLAFVSLKSRLTKADEGIIDVFAKAPILTRLQLARRETRLAPDTRVPRWTGAAPLPHVGWDAGSTVGAVDFLTRINFLLASFTFVFFRAQTLEQECVLYSYGG